MKTTSASVDSAESAVVGSSSAGGSSESVRLQKYLARAGIASRRASEKLILEGHVRVNGAAVVELGSKVCPGIDAVEVDGAPVREAASAATLMLNKPAGFLTSMSDPHGRPCVSRLVPCDEYPGLFPVGRLDMDTTGLLLFTTDGELGNALLHPSRHVDKTYEARVHGVPDKRALAALRKGVLLEDGPTHPAQVDLVRKTNKGALLRITIHEGRKRQVKRMCEAVGHPVVSLHRVSFGSLELGDLAIGQWRLLAEAEVEALKEAARNVGMI